jgi:hypothetical protein
MEVHPMSNLVKLVKRGGLVAALVTALGLAVASSGVASPLGPDCKHCTAPAAAPQDKPDKPKGDDKADKPDKPKGDDPAEDKGPKAEGPKADGPKVEDKAAKPDKPAKADKPDKPKHKGNKHAAPAIAVTAPSAVAPQQAILGQQLRACTSRRALTIHIRRHRGVHYRSATVTMNGKRIATRRGKRITAPISLQGLPKGTYRLVIRVVTSKGKVLRGTRTYHTCAPRRTPLHAPSL